MWRRALSLAIDRSRGLDDDHRDAGLELAQPFAGAGEHFGLDVELLTRHQIEPGKARGQHRPEILLQVAGGAFGKQLAYAG